MPKAPRAVVTGGGRGIGAAIARKLKASGYQVILMARTRGPIDRLADEIRAHAVRIDVGDPASVEAAFMAAGPVDLLINNAAIVRAGPVTQTDVRVWEEHLKVNLTGAFLCSLKVLPGMISRGRGRIINIAGTPSGRGFANLAAYCASKEGLSGFTRALAAEVADKGVRVNALAPSFVDSPLFAEILSGIAERTDLKSSEARAGLLERAGQTALLSPEAVADAVLALAGDAGADLNGEILTLDDPRLLLSFPPSE